MDTSPDSQESLQRAEQFIKEGKVAEAQNLIADLLKLDQRNAQAWYLRSLVTTDSSNRVSYLERALYFDPQHQASKARIQQLERTIQKGQVKRFLVIGVIVLLVAMLVIGMSYYLSPVKPTPTPRNQISTAIPGA